VAFVVQGPQAEMRYGPKLGYYIFSQPHHDPITGKQRYSHFPVTNSSGFCRLG
jgi:hypothetical protein